MSGFPSHAELTCRVETWKYLWVYLRPVKEFVAYSVTARVGRTGALSQRASGQRVSDVELIAAGAGAVCHPLVVGLQHDIRNRLDLNAERLEVSILRQVANKTGRHTILSIDMLNPAPSRRPPGSRTP